MASGEKYVTRDAVFAAEMFMLWQAQLKQHFHHGRAEQVTSGELSTIIMDVLQRIDKEGKYTRPPVIQDRLQISLARVIDKFGWIKYGIDGVTRTIDSLVKAGQLQYGLKYGVGKPGEEGRKIVTSKHHVVVTRFE